MSREIILSRLRIHHKVKTNDELYNVLQGCTGTHPAVISDQLEPGRPIPDSELMTAYKMAGLEAL